MREFFFEIRSGEIPARMQKAVCQELKVFLEDALQKWYLEWSDIETYIGPRRLIGVVKGLSSHQPLRREERKGPRTDASPAAIEGFVKSTGRPLEDLEVRETSKGNFYFFTQEIQGLPTTKVLPQLLQELIETFPWPKRMTWGCSIKSWIRPITGGCAVFDGAPLEFDILLSDCDAFEPLVLSFSDTTVGHRSLAPSPFKVKNFADYQQKLRKAFVIIDPVERREIIKQQIEKICSEYQLVVQEDADLLEEVIGLVEWPVCLFGKIDAIFMALPPEVLRTSMRVHQRYFSFHYADGSFAPFFIVVANQPAPDQGKVIVLGNERVLKARLRDAQFFYDHDQKVPLQVHGDKLRSIIFQAGLGSVSDKQERLQKLIKFIGQGDMEASKAAQEAALICKADLVTDMVKEFPELQGIMGSYYARLEGRSSAVAQALYQQYTPKGPQDHLPIEKPSQLLAIADRIDTLVGFFSLNLKPTGSKDPFALRRSALGIIRFLEEDSDWTLHQAIEFSYKIYEENSKKYSINRSFKEVASDLESFFLDRLQVYWKEKGFRYDYIQAALIKGFQEPLYVIKKRLEALTMFMKGSNELGHNLLAGYKRASNILKREEDSLQLKPEVMANLLELPEEKELYEAVNKGAEQLQSFLKEFNFVESMRVVATLRKPIDHFFEKVVVNDSRAEMRLNRLSLLKTLQATLEQVAMFSKLEG